MLDTVLEIGRTLRDPDNREKGLRHHRYVKPCPTGEEDEVLRLRIPVTGDFETNLDGITPISDERLFERLFYLTYKMADSSNQVKYIFGDIYFTQEKGSGTSPGYYRMGDPNSGAATFRKDSFDRGKDDAEEIIEREQTILSGRKENRGSVIESFREGLNRTVGGQEAERKIDLIERLLTYQAGVGALVERGVKIDEQLLSDEPILRFEAAKQTFAEIKNSRYSASKFRGALNESDPEWEELKSSEEAIQALADYASGNIFLHFDIGGEHWYEQESAMHAIDQQFVSKFTESFSEGEHEGIVPMKYFYKTMASPDSSLQIPGFKARNQSRIRLFSEDELMDLFYAINMAKTPKFRPYSTDVKIIVLPRGDDMSPDDIMRFKQEATSPEEAAEQEMEFRGGTRQEAQTSIDDLLDGVLRDAPEPIVEFDLVFSEADSRGQDADLVELSGVSRSFLEKVRERIGHARRAIEKEYREKMGHELENLTIYRAFRSLLSGVGQDQPRYQRHLYRMLPKIYSETYHRDPMLLPALVEKTEKAVRDGDASDLEFNRLNHYFRFLAHIQTTDPIMQITDSESYKLGRPLGVMARPLRSRINPFEKNYVGNLRRRIATLDDLIEFKNEIEEMLVRQEVAKYPSVVAARRRLHDHLNTMEESARVDKNRCALGFFESYFEPFEEDNGNENS